MVEDVNKALASDHSVYTELYICTYNIIAGAQNRINAAVRCLRTMNIDIALITETKLQGYHTTQCEGYDIVASRAKSKHQGGVALCYRRSKNFHIEGTRIFGPNVIAATLISGRKKWRLVGAYIPPSEEDGSTLGFAQAAAAISPELPLILLGDLNVDLMTAGETATNDTQGEKVAFVASLGLKDLNQHFRQRRGIGDWTWSMLREGRRLYRRCDYILTTDTTDFRTLRIKNPRFDSDHRMLLGVLKSGSTRQHKHYVNSRSRYSLEIRPEDKTRADFLMEELTEFIEKPPSSDPQSESWISEATWKLFDAKAQARRRGDSVTAKNLKKPIRKSLQADRKRRIDKLSTEIEALLKAKQVQTAYGLLRGWYREKPGHIAKPTIQDEKKTRDEYESLFTPEESPGEPIPIHRSSCLINDSPPTAEEVCEALMGMKLGKTPGGSGIRVEHLRDWMEGAKPGESQKQSCLEAWNRVLELVELAFTGQPLPRSFGIGILVLIPKGVPDQYRGIALLEIIYKLISAIINRRLAAKITFHDAVHGFCRGRGTGTAVIEAKLRMQLAQRTTKPRYFVFLDLKKAYDTLDRGRTIAILKGYGIGRNILSIIKRIWDMDTMVPKQAGFYGESFSAGRGVRQGDILSPMIFNIVVDAVIRESEVQISESRGQQRRTVDALFYADDGALMGEDAMEVQSSLDIYTKTFSRVGLKMNAEKQRRL